jgi:hypothetical protein
MASKELRGKQVAQDKTRRRKDTVMLAGDRKPRRINDDLHVHHNFDQNHHHDLGDADYPYSVQNARRESKIERRDPYRHQVLSRGAQRSFGLLERRPDAVLSYSAPLLTGLSFSAQKEIIIVLSTMCCYYC